MPTLDNFLLFVVASVLLQSLFLGATRIVISVAGDLVFVFSAAAVARWLAERPAWALAQRWVLGTVFAGITAKLAFDERR
jgi:threonine/homoserine/homoserine lactone efflux protein